MKSIRRLSGLCLLALLALSTPAAVPPAEQLLPADTFLMVSVPDWTKAMAAYDTSPQGQLWRDPEMKAFREKYEGQFKTKIVAALERELGVSLTNFSQLFQGQVSLAILQGDWKPESGSAPDWLLLIDARDKADLLKQTIADVRKKLGEAGKTLKTEKLRDLEFSSLTCSDDDLFGTFEKAFTKDAPNASAKDKPEASTNKIQLVFGQCESLLLVGNETKQIEKVLIRQSGGKVPVLAEQPGFTGCQGLFRNGLAIGWFNFKPVLDLFVKATEKDGAGSGNPLEFQPKKFLAASGLDQLSTLAFSLGLSGEGSLAQIALAVPAAQRKGLVKALEFGAKESAPPPFVPAEAIKCSRWRLDLQKTWAALEAMLAEMSPEISGLLQMTLETAGKDKDPNFSLKKSLIGNLGDDIVSYQKPPRGTEPATLGNPPSLVLVGSPNAEALAQAVKTGVILPGDATPASPEREFLGRKIYTLPLPGGPMAGGKAPSLKYAASGGYVAFSSDEGLLEEYLRSSEGKAKPLQETTGLREAAQSIGGLSTGWFGYENQAETAKHAFELYRKDPSAFEKNLGLAPVLAQLGPKAADFSLKDWFDYSLLPPFEKVAKYFGMLVYTGAVTPEGFEFKFFTPQPPGLKK